MFQEENPFKAYGHTKSLKINYENDEVNIFSLFSIYLHIEEILGINFRRGYLNIR